MRRIDVCFLTGFPLPSFTEPESRHCEFWRSPINAEDRGTGKAVNNKLIEPENKSVTFSIGTWPDPRAARVGPAPPNQPDRGPESPNTCKKARDWSNLNSWPAPSKS